MRLRTGLPNDKRDSSRSLTGGLAPMTEKETTAQDRITPESAVTGVSGTAMPRADTPASATGFTATPADKDMKEPDRTLRLWPGVLLVGLMWPVIAIPPRV